MQCSRAAEKNQQKPKHSYKINYSSSRGVVLKKEVGGRLKRDLDNDL